MTPRRYNILFLCTGNSARSIVAESIANNEFSNRFTGYSAGSFPKGQVNPDALHLLAGIGHDISKLSSKSWDVFAGEDAPGMDFILTVCDEAAQEICPIWPGHPCTANWGVSDPSDLTDADMRAAGFRKTCRIFRARLEKLASLPLETMPRDEIRASLADLGKVTG